MSMQNMPTTTQQSEEPVAPRRRSRESGSVLVMTLLGIGLIAAVFLYVAVLGSRTNETLRARNSADATAMAAAIVKAKVLNYEAFIVLADTVLLPLKQVSGNIRTAQALVLSLCAAGAIFFPAMAKYCLEYAPHVIKTTAASPKIDKEVGDWLDGLEGMAEALIKVGPVWAGVAATAAGTYSDYRTGKGGVSLALAFPVPLGGSQECKDLGLEMVDNEKKIQGRDACHDQAYLELLYIATSGKPSYIALDTLGMTLIGKLLTLGASCDARNMYGQRIKVPALKSNWKKYSTSHGMALVTKPSDRDRIQHLSGFGNIRVTPTLGTGLLLGMACAEHYSNEHPKQESLWYMDWRARLIPCEYEKQERVRRVTQCTGGVGLPISLQFQNEMRLGIAKDWKW